MRHDSNYYALKRWGFAFRIECAIHENVALGVVHRGVSRFYFGELGRPDVVH